MFAEERKAVIVKILQEKKRVTNHELIEQLHVSGTTIRSYLSELEAQHKLIRTHGGAMIIEDPIVDEESISARIDKNIEEKRYIAHIAKRFIHTHDTILLDTGTTCLEFAKCLLDFDSITVITNDLQIAFELQKNPHIHIIFLGGTVRNFYNCTVGSTVISALQNLSIDTGFIAANAFSKQYEISTPHLETAEVKKAMMTCCHQRYLLIDSAKIGQRTLCTFAHSSDFDGIITNTDKTISTWMDVEQLGTQFIMK